MVLRQPLIMADPELVTPPDRPFWTEPWMVDDKKLWPTYSSSEVAHCFFGRSTVWLAHRLCAGHHVTDEYTVDPPRRTSGYRAYRLYDIETMAHAFAGHRAISVQRLEQSIRMVRLSARMHGYLEG